MIFFLFFILGILTVYLAKLIMVQSAKYLINRVYGRPLADEDVEVVKEFINKIDDVKVIEDKYKGLVEVYTSKEDLDWELKYFLDTQTFTIVDLLDARNHKNRIVQEGLINHCHQKVVMILFEKNKDKIISSLTKTVEKLKEK